MAGKTSSSVGVGVTITLLSLSTLGLFVTTAILLGKYSSQREQYNQQKNETEQYIKLNERDQGEVRQLVEDARKSNQSLVTYLRTRVGGVMKSATGADKTSFEQFDTNVKKELGGEGTSLLAVLAARAEQIKSLNDQVKAAEAARASALASLESARTQVNDTQKALIAENDKLKGQVTGYEAELKTWRGGLDTAEEKMRQAIRELEAAHAARGKTLEAKISSLEREGLVLVEQLAKLRGQQSTNVLQASSEEALVDGRVLDITSDGKQITIDVGSKQKVPLGITFAVYADSKQIKVDDKTGEYRRGKATVEVINVGPTTATCRVNSETRGSPILKGDVVANAVYDPSKVYKFVIFGNFDANGDGAASQLERGDVVSMVEGWGGKVVPDLSGDVDFLILGEKPILPPRPGDGSPFEVVQLYVKMEQELRKYDELYKSAQSTSVPILNQNRFMTLIGAKPMRAASR